MDYAEPNKVDPQTIFLYSFVYLNVIIAKSLHTWMVDTGATKHVTRDRNWLIDYHRVPSCSHYISMENGALEEVLGVGIYRIKLALDVSYSLVICNMHLTFYVI